MIYTTEVKNKIKENRALRSAIMDYFEVTEYTLLKWLREDAKPLYHIGVTRLIIAYTQTDETDLFIKN